MARNGIQKSKTERERYWAEWNRKWEKSDLTQPEFCRKNGLASPSFKFWRAELRRREQGEAKKPKFVPVALKSQPAPSIIEITVGHGRLIRVPADLGRDCLKTLIRTVEEA